MQFTQLKSLALLCLALLIAPVWADDVDIQQQLDALQAKVDNLQTQLAEQKQSHTQAWGESFSKRVNFNGFISFGLSKTTDRRDDIPYYHGQTKDVSVVPNSWLGLRFDTLLYEGGEVVAQFVVKGDTDEKFNLRTEWLFLKQELGAGFSAHIGRIRLPVHLDSEVIFIGNLYPTVATAAEIYSVLSMNHLDGVSINHRLALPADWVMDSKLILWGQGRDLRGAFNFRLKETQGAALSFSNDALTLRLAAFTSKKVLSIDYPVNAQLPSGFSARLEDRIDFYTAAMRYDNRRLYATLEGIAVNSHNDIMDETRNWNAIFGFYTGPVLLYGGFARHHSSNIKEMKKALTKELGVVNISLPPPMPASIPAGEIFGDVYNVQKKALKAGLKYDVTAKVVLKAQAQYLYGFQGTRGGFQFVSVNQGNNVNGKIPDHIMIYDLAIQAFF